MKKTGFYRLLFSYLPVFLIMIAAVIVIALIQLSEMSKQEAVRANESFIGFMRQSVDASLMNMDEAVVDFLNKGMIHDFYYDADKQADQLLAYQIATEMYRMVTRSDLIDAMYLYRAHDETVLSYDTQKPLSEFGDRAFIGHMLEQRFSNYYWSDVRPYRSLEGNAQQQVVSLVRKVPLLTGTHGLLVVNINTESIQSLAATIFGDNKSYFTISDRSLQPIAGNAARLDDGGLVNRVRVQLSNPNSSYTGWVYESGFFGGPALTVSSAFSYVGWMGLLAIVLLGSLWIVWATRRHYKPIESIVARIDAYTHSKTEALAGTAHKRDEFRFIQTALDDLVKQSNDYQRQYSEGLVHRNRQVFFELMHGTADIGKVEWERTAADNGFASPYSPVQAAVIEIDRYGEFEAGYTTADQNLLKFVLASMVREMGVQYGIAVWKEWMAPDQLTLLIDLSALQESSRQADAMLKDICDWVSGHLDFTVTIGISRHADSYESLPEQYEAAIEALGHKATLGRNRTIHAVDIACQPASDLFHNTRLIKAAVTQLKNGEATWRTELESLFQLMLTGRLSRDEISSLVHFMSFQLHRELNDGRKGELEEPFQAWNADVEKLLESYDVLDDLKEGLFVLLERLAGLMSHFQENRSNRKLIDDVKGYLDKHYSDPDISLIHITDRFGIKYVSQFFKEEIGEKFSDYVAGVRIEKAKRLLLETEDSVQEIASRVGYTHSFSFIRMFKRIVGRTPGEYRKEQASFE